MLAALNLLVREHVRCEYWRFRGMGEEKMGRCLGYGVRDCGNVAPLVIRKGADILEDDLKGVCTSRG